MRFSTLLASVVVIAGGTAATTDPATANADANVPAIRAHFDTVLSELVARDVRALSQAQRTRRADLIVTLRAYRDRGVFPHNYDFPGRAVPYFVDRKTGTLCAVANLLASTERRDIVDRVARADNNAWVRDLASDTAFTGWLDANGVTLAEAARIQVPYVGPTQPLTPPQQARNTVFFTAAPIALAGAVVTGVWNSRGNADGHRRAVNVLGLASGIATAGMGARMSKAQMPPGIGVTGMAIGSISAGLAIRAMMHRSSALAAIRAADQTRAEPTATVAPFVGAGNGTGVSVSIRF